MSSRSARNGPRDVSPPLPGSAAAVAPPPTRAACKATQQAGKERDRMTWSIIARDSATGQIGIAVATKFFAVGARVPHIAPGKGGVATQALVNPYYGIDGVRLLQDGKSPEAIVTALLATDEGRESRQLHVMDAHGRIAAHTGKDCVDWCGHLAGDGFSIAGNMLASPAVLDETAKAYRANATLPFARRLLAAMRAGEAA